MSRELLGGKSDFPPEEIEHRDTRRSQSCQLGSYLQNGRNVATTSSLEFKIKYSVIKAELYSITAVADSDMKPCDQPLKQNNTPRDWDLIEQVQI